MIRRTVVLAAALVLALASAARSIQIARISVEGNVNLSEQKILSIFGLKPGEEYKSEKVSQGIRNLLRTKDFSDVVAYYGEENGTALIVVHVEEYPRVKAIRIEGAKNVKKEDIQGKILLREGYFARPTMITQDVSAIRDLCGEKGYNNARITVRRDPVPDQHTVTVSYVIEEGEKVKIRHIDFIGNGAVDSKQLRGVLESKEDRWWRGGEYKPKVLKEDIKKMIQLYQNKGYLDAAVAVEKDVEVADGKHVDIYIKVEEGPRYYVGDITWAGNEIVGDEDIERLMTLHKGDPFSIEEVEFLKYNLNSLYWEKGYIYSRIVPERRIERQTIDLELNIVENNPAYIHEIKISGNTKTFEPVIRRELRVYPGDKFVLGEVQRSVRDVVALGFFEGPPKIDYETINEQGDINLMIEVKEKQSGMFKSGFGFSQLNSLTGFLGISENNLFGRGKSFAFDWEFGKWRRNLNIRYSEPYLLGTNNALTVSVFDWIQDRVSQQYYTDRRKGFSVQLGRPFPWLDYTRFYVSYRFETVKLYNFSDVYPEYGVLRRTKWPLDKSSVMFNLTRDSTDNPFHPTKGSISNIGTEFSGGPLQGNVEFVRYMAGVSWFRQLFWKFTFHMEMNAGLVDVFGGAEQVQDFEKFRLGGNRRFALRGYDFYEVVPEGNDIYEGGRFMTTFTQEVLFPFSAQVYGLVFLDAGNTWNSFREADIFRMRRGLGLGVRLEMPGLGNLGFDYGYGFDKEGGPAWEPHFTFGTFF